MSDRHPLPQPQLELDAGDQGHQHRLPGEAPFFSERQQCRQDRGRRVPDHQPRRVIEIEHVGERPVHPRRLLRRDANVTRDHARTAGRSVVREVRPQCSRGGRLAGGQRDAETVEDTALRGADACFRDGPDREARHSGRDALERSLMRLARRSLEPGAGHREQPPSRARPPLSM